MDPQQQNNGFGPLSKPRGKKALLAALIVIVISGALHVRMAVVHATADETQSKDKLHFLVFGTALLILSLVLGELVRRMCLVFEEIQHKQARYEGSWKKVFTSTFSFRYGRSILIVTVVSLLILSYALYEQCDTFYRSDYAILFSLNCFLVPQLLFLAGFRELSIVEVSQINERENKNVADGLAWSYYFGYLKLVLPHLEDQIAKTDDFRYKISQKKLFILLPKTCFTWDKIVDADPRVKCVGNLKDREINRGGIKKRSYKHTVHLIEMPRPDGKIDKYHVVLEYATPLMSLYDMSENAECGLNRQQRDEQVF